MIDGAVRFEVSDRQGEAHSYECDLFDGWQGTSLNLLLHGRCAGALSGLDGALGDLASVLGSLNGRSLQEAMADGGSGIEVDLGAILSALGRSVQSLLAGLDAETACRIMAQTVRDGEQLVVNGKPTRAWRQAYRANGTELIVAMGRVAHANGFLPDVGSLSGLLGGLGKAGTASVSASSSGQPAAG